METRLRAVEERNTRVEADKAWETSWARRGMIAAITYLAAAGVLLFIGAGQAWLGALVPVAGYVISTLSLPPLKKMWAAGQEKQKVGNDTGN